MNLSGQTVLLVCPSGWPLPNFKWGVEALGGRIERFQLSTTMARPDWADGGRSNAELNHELREKVSAMRPLPRMAIFIAYDDCLEGKTVRHIRRLGVYTVCYHADMQAQWYRILRTGRSFDLVACAQKANIGSLRANGIRAEFVPMAACPPSAAPVDAYERVVGYVGAPQPYRLWMLDHLKRNFPVRCYGRWFGDEAGRDTLRADTRLLPKPMNAKGRLARGFFNLRYLPSVIGRSPDLIFDRRRTPRYRVTAEDLRAHWGGAVHEGSLSAAFARSFVNLGFTYYSGKPETRAEKRQCGLREFEGPLYSQHGPYVVQDFPELKELYHKNDEVVVWNTYDELVSKLRWLFAHESEAAKIAARGRKAAMTRHLWSRRIEQLLSYRRVGR